MNASQQKWFLGFETSPLVFAFALFGVVACGGGSGPGATGDGGDGDEPGTDDETGVPSDDEPIFPSDDLDDEGPCTPGEAAPFKLRRLTRSQLDHTVRDLLGTDVRPSADLAADERVGPFYSNLNIPVDALLVERFEVLAQSMAEKADMAKLAACGTKTGRACAEHFLQTFGRRAFRRPLDTQETELFLGYYDGSASKGHEVALRLLLRVLLQSPNFLYLAEFGGEDGKLTPFELAARLSYFLWDTTPDEALLDAAGSGQLDTPEGLRAEVDRMLADARASAGLRAFHLPWLELDHLEGLTKNPMAFPEHGPALNAAMADEVERFVEHVFRDGDGRLQSLLTTSIGFPSGPLAAVYGVDAAPEGEPVPMDPQQRAGLLTLPGFLSVHAHADQTSPVRRGVIVRQRLLCQELPSPPPNVNNAVPPVAEDATTRERFAAHEADPACASCHVLIDPIGLGFENYDAIGRFRSEENGKPVDATGEIIEAAGLEGPFDGAIELAQRMAASPLVASCLTRQWFGFALGRLATDGDRCLIRDMRNRLLENDGDLRALIADVVTSPAFNHLTFEGAAP